jgi:hypothetical protein
MARAAISDCAVEKTARLQVAGVPFEEILRFRYGFVDPLRFPVHLGEAFTDDRRLGVERIRLFVGVDGLRGEFGLIGRLILLLEEVPHGVVVVSLGARRRRHGRLRRRCVGPKLGLGILLDFGVHRSLRGAEGAEEAGQETGETNS